MREQSAVWSYNQYRRVTQHFLGSVVEHGLAVLDPAKGAKWIASDADNDMGVDAAPGQPQS
jgi:hypothetical protein